jgi:glycosyltransferase involved in cell wall biosynthesis
VGRLHPVKGHVYLLQAVEILLKKGLKFSLTVVGDGEERRGLERLRKGLRLEESILFAGALYGEDLRDRLRESDIFILSSISEGLPVSMLEAMSVGLTVVLPNITGIPEMITTVGGGGGMENGLLFETKNSQDLASKLEVAIRDHGLRERLGAEARKTVLSKCSHDATYGRMAEVITGKGR